MSHDDQYNWTASDRHFWVSGKVLREYAKSRGEAIIGDGDLPYLGKLFSLELAAAAARVWNAKGGRGDNFEIVQI